MWLIIFAAVIITAIGGLIYLAAGFHRFAVVKKIAEKNKAAAWVISFAAVAVIALPWLLFVNAWAMAVVLIHLFLFNLIFDAVSFIASKIRKRKPERNISTTAAMVFTAAYLSIGWYAAHNVVITHYDLTTEKNIGEPLRIALIADVHLGITLDGDEFAEQMKRLDDLNVDAVMIAGDFVDDDSNRADMEKACAALGNIKTKYGVFFAYGNHDMGYFDGSRDFSVEDFAHELDKNGVTILIEDKIIMNDKICIIGRDDAYAEGRMPIAEFMKNTPDSAYSIVLDHQPSDYDAEAESGVDLVLSGHTHGGHIFPTGYVGTLTGINDRIYGHEKRGNSDFIVTSGISGWAIPFKTGTKSEIVIVDIKNRSEQALNE